MTNTLTSILVRPVHWPVNVSLLVIRWSINYDFISLTFAPHANNMRISSSGCINIIASARLRCKGFVTHSPGILNNRTVNLNQKSISSLLNVNLTILCNILYVVKWFVGKFTKLLGTFTNYLCPSLEICLIMIFFWKSRNWELSINGIGNKSFSMEKILRNFH